MNSLIRRFKSNEFLKNILIVTGGNVLAKIVVIFAMPILTRLYSPEDFGIFSVFTAITGIFASIITLRYAVTISLVKNENSAENLLKLSLLVTLIMSFSSFVIIQLSGKNLLEYANMVKIEPYLWLLPIVLMATGCYQSINYWALRKKQFSAITRSTIVRSLYSTLTKLILGLLKVKPLGLLIGVVIQEISGVFSLFKNLLKERPNFFKKMDWISIFALAKRYKKFPLIQSWSQLLLATSSQSPVLLLGYFYGLEVAGVFALAQNMLSIPMNLIGQSVAQVYFAEICKLGKQEPKKIYDLSISMMTKMFLISIFPVLILVMAGPVIFEFTFGQEWADSGVYVRYLSILLIMQFITSPLGNIFNLFEKQNSQLFLNLIRVILVYLAFYICFYVNAPVEIAILTYSLLLSLQRCVVMFISLKIVK